MLRVLIFNIITLLGALLPGDLSMQEGITLVQGEEIIIPTSMEIPRIFGRDESGYFALGRDHRYYLEHFNNDFKSTVKNYLILHRGLRTRDLEAIFYFQGKIYIFSSELRFSKKILYVQTIDKNNLRQFDDEKQVMEIEHLKGWFAYFHFRLSRKEDKLLVYSQRDAYRQNIQDLYFHMYGKDLTLEWERGERVTYERRSPRKSTVKVSDEGNVFIMSLLDDQNLMSLLNVVKNRYFLLALTDSGRTVNHYYVDFPNLYIRGLQIEPGKNHDLSCVGFYSPSHYRESIDGMFYFTVNNRGNQIKNLRFHEIEPYFLKEAMNRREKNESEEIFSFRIKHLILRDNGDFIMLAEHEYDQTYDTYMNIIAASFSPGGTLNWKRIIPKRQNFDPKYEINHCSYAVHAPWYGNPVYLLFNDNPRNRDWPSGRKIYSFGHNDKAVLKSVEIGPSGELSSSILYRKNRRRMKTPLPLAYYDPLNDDMILPFIRYRKLSFYKITF